MAKGLIPTDSMEEAVLLWVGRVNLCRAKLCCASCAWGDRTSRDAPGDMVVQRIAQDESFLKYRGQ